MSVVAILCGAIAVFTQLSLPDAMRRAVFNSASVQMAIASVEEREAQLHLARISAVPHLNGDYSLAPQAGPFDNGTVEQHFITVGAGVSISDLMAGPSIVHAAAGELVAAQRNAAAAELAARENAATLYFSALQSMATERIRDEDLLGAQRDRAAADLRNRNGEAPELDVLRADVTLSQARADAVRAQAQRADAVAALASATAVNPDTLTSLSDSSLAPPKPIDERTAVARALAMRPELSALLASLEARNAELAGARRWTLPNA
ncbi:MAG: TolC family protein, partial [Candidatus Cybelea sp.]